ncbi:MAG: YggS family pyridoxal phosphate-dependent enzyme [Clostridiales bacterium]|nr:YggS family pyridoxal phosphate-dependent enzyme [Clostridiales bacterium]
MENIRDNLEEVRKNIKIACEKVNRNPNDVTLIAVTKTIDDAIVNESLKYDITDIGENKPQEVQRKFDLITKKVKWHLIGHLQRNKVKYIIDKVDLIHSVDSERLAMEINNRALGIGKVMDILIQLNISNEETKFGIDRDALDTLLLSISNMANIRVRGLMTMAPYLENPEDTRWIFKKMKEIFEDLKDNEYNNIQMDYLSMGMTNDYMIAIEEGANLIRIGTGIYGERDYSK